MRHLNSADTQSKDQGLAKELIGLNYACFLFYDEPTIWAWKYWNSPHKPSYTLTQSSTCLCLSSTEIKGMCVPPYLAQAVHSLFLGVIWDRGYLFNFVCLVCVWRIESRALYIRQLPRTERHLQAQAECCRCCCCFKSPLNSLLILARYLCFSSTFALLCLGQRERTHLCDISFRMGFLYLVHRLL